MAALGFAIALLVIGAIVTQLCKILLEWLHPPRGRFLEIAGLRQHVVDLGQPAGAAKRRRRSFCCMARRATSKTCGRSASAWRRVTGSSWSIGPASASASGRATRQLAGLSGRDPARHLRSPRRRARRRGRPFVGRRHGGGVRARLSAARRRAGRAGAADASAAASHDMVLCGGRNPVRGVAISRRRCRCRSACC